ncbi:UNVERIFIED_ORG: threonine/homoserine/homoserine lactone efflux protein [Martelella mediterranea]
MTNETLLALIGFALAASITPGPNNMMVFASTVNFGFSRTLPHISGVVAGFALLMAGVGAGLGAVITAFPSLLVVAKIAGALYLLWIAWKIGTTRKMASGEATTGRPLTFFQAVGFQWVNPKGWIMGLTAMSVFTDPADYARSVAIVAVVFGLITIPSISLWAGFGSGLRHWLSYGNRLKWFNIVMALVLVASLWPMLR